MIPGWRTLRSTLKPWKKQTQDQFQDQETAANVLGKKLSIYRNGIFPFNAQSSFHRYLCAVRTTRLSQNDQARSICIIKCNALQSLHQTFRAWCNNRFGGLAVTGTCGVNKREGNHFLKFLTGCRSRYLIRRTLQALNFPVR